MTRTTPSTPQVGIVPPEEALKYSGIDLLLKMKAGELPYPPFVETMGIEFDTIEDGLAIFLMKPAFAYYNGLGCLHGGVISTLLDTAMGCAVQTRIPQGVTYTTVEFKTNFLRPVYEHTGIIRAEARLIHIGRTTATAEAKLYDERGKLYAFSTTTCTIIRS